MHQLRSKRLMAASSVAVLLALSAGHAAAEATATDSRESAAQARERDYAPVGNVKPGVYAPTGESNRGIAEAIGDAALIARINMRLAAEENLSAQDIKVHSLDNVVTLRGVVPSEEAKLHAERLVRENYSEVRQVRNELRVDAQAARMDGERRGDARMGAGPARHPEQQSDR
ncbi:BON domain-containing protein [Ramlibacter sp. AW1]|uniref:BON domain-containing protein n=1 Tax=Ramlibacter aurantiacus TaxID=2801330 RepID=A0A937D1B5_9BURK|nr:BON domain-containing protein [Ramlibacter aurantiacus]MBL0420349.1 BON domain-containing protein [Ramlibacter aurantiacus]